MALLDFVSVLFICGALLAAAITGRFGRGTLTVARDILLPAGITGTFIGFIHLLQQMDEPTEIFPAISVGLLTALYAAILKWGLDIRLSASPGPTPSDPGLHGWLAATLWLIIVVAAILLGSPFIPFLDGWALAFFMLSTLSICGLTLASGHENIPAALARYLPGAGLLILYASLVAVLPALKNPSEIGPILAWGLLGHFYCYMLAIVLHLTHPHRMKPDSATSQWLVSFASIGGACLQMALVGVAISMMP